VKGLSVRKKQALNSCRRIVQITSSDLEERGIKMNNRFDLKGIVILFFVTLTLTLGICSMGYAGGQEGGPEGATISGKRVFAMFTALLADIPDGSEHVTQAILGTCKQEPFVLGPLADIPIDPVNFDSIKAECEDENDTDCLRYYVVGEGGPPGCYSVPGGEDLIITRVIRFIRYESDFGAAIRAWVVLRKVELE